METRQVIGEGIDMVFVLFAELVLRLSGRRDAKLLPSPQERLSVARPGSRLITRHVDIDTGSANDAIDGAQLALGAGHWGLRVITGQDALEPLDPIEPKETP